MFVAVRNVAPKYYSCECFIEWGKKSITPKKEKHCGGECPLLE